MPEDRAHVPVFFHQTIELLAPRPGAQYIDGTVGAGGHAAGIADAAAPSGRVLGLDADPLALAVAGRNLAYLGDRIVLRHSNFSQLKRIARETGFDPANGLVLDLGLSSMQLADEGRGFSFAGAGPLDMRFDPRAPVSAGDLVNGLSEKELADLIFGYGEEHASRRIARAIVQARPVGTAAELAAVVERATGRRGRIHPATRTFQALRIAVNRELDVLQETLPQIADVLVPGGRVVIISFHSLEDRIVKNFFRESKELRVLTKHPIQATRDQELSNPKSRSAKLRAAERVA